MLKSIKCLVFEGETLSEAYLFTWSFHTGQYEVGVHIADVSYFVKENTKLDKVAASRATSVYLVQKVNCLEYQQKNRKGDLFEENDYIFTKSDIGLYLC